MILKYYEGTNPADKTGDINYVDLNKVAQVKIVQTKIGDLDKYTFVLDGSEIYASEISRIFAANSSCMYYFFDNRYEVEKLVDDMLLCHLTNKAYIYDIDENIIKLNLNCSGRGYNSKGWH